jgi:hypothetical protein
MMMESAALAALATGVVLMENIIMAVAKNTFI